LTTASSLGRTTSEELPPDIESLVWTIAATGIRDERLLDTLRRVPRAAFVPPELVDRAYIDEPVPIPHGQVTTQPSLVARMVEALALRGGERVLEVGTGYGYQTAVLAELAGFVWSIERWADLAETARQNLARHGASSVEVVVGDGTEGLPQHSPYDAIVVSAAFPEVPEPLAAQLEAGGRLVHPLGRGGSEEVVLFEKVDGLARRRSVARARFVRLLGRHGFSDAGPEA
jgi:protein-L-isoaspartate(D-aspartate) O-methyltransferase